MGILRLCGVLALCACLAPVHAQEGTRTAQWLNARFTSTPEQCVGRSPAFACSGVLVRSVPQSANADFWTLKDVAGSDLRFVFLRNDRSMAGLALGCGYLLFDGLSAAALGKAFQAVQDPVSPGAVLVSGWQAQAPAQLAIQALFHDSAQAGGLRCAQRNQLAYYQATGLWLPILRIAPGDPQAQVFGFAQQEQLYNGRRVAERLEHRYRDALSECRDGQAAAYCRGVLIRAVNGASGFHAWNPSSNSVTRNGVSFSYIRSDVGTQRLAGTEGLIYRELATPARHTLVMRCAYPANASSSVIPNSCRASCASQNINSVSAWRSRYGASPVSSCAFDPSAAAFELNIEVRAHGGAWNEIIIAPWPQNIGPQLTLEAAFLIRGSGGLNGARYIQRDYYQQAGKVIPVLRVDLTAANGQVFAFDPLDQNL